MTVAKMMNAHELFQSLGFEDVEKVSSFTGIMNFKEGEKVFASESFGSHIFILMEGKLDLRLSARSGEASLVMGRVEKGEMFGLSPLIGSGRHTTTAECTAPCKVLAIEAKPLLSLLENNALIGLEITSMIARVYFSRYIETMKRVQRVINEIAAF